MELKDWGLSQLGMDIWAKKYQNNGESFEEWLDRVSGGDKDVRQLIVDKKMLFGGRILASRGVTDRKVTYSNCYVLPQVPDSIEGIYETCRDLAKTFSAYCDHRKCKECDYKESTDCIKAYVIDLLSTKGE